MFLPSFDTDVRSGKRKNDRFAYGSFEVMRVSLFGWTSVVLVVEWGVVGGCDAGGDDDGVFSRTCDVAASEYRESPQVTFILDCACVLSRCHAIDIVVHSTAYA